MSTENSSSTVENAETTSSPSETGITTASGLSLREELAAALNLDTSDTPEEPVTNVTPDVTGEAETVAETPTLEVLEAPSNWPAEQREKFTVLPRETQEWLLSRDKEMVESYTRKTTELAEQRKAAEEVTSVLEPYRQQMELAGVSPSQAIQRLLAAQKFLESNPSEGIKWLAQQYQVDLSGFTPKEETYTDPDVKALRDELNQFKAERQREQQRTQTESISAIQRQINEFKDSRNEDGTLKYPHFEKVKAVMAPLVNEGKSLAEAYETAQYILPETRERIAAEAAKAAQAEAIRKAEEQRKAKAKEVKTAAQVIRSRGTGTSESTAKSGTVRQDLERAFQELQSGRI